MNEGRRTLLHNAVLGDDVRLAARRRCFVVRRFAFPDHPESVQESPARVAAREIGAADRAAVGMPTDPAFALAAGKLPDDVTDSDRHYVISKNFRDPTVKREGWKITVDGLVERPVTVTYDDLPHSADHGAAHNGVHFQRSGRAPTSARRNGRVCLYVTCSNAAGVQGGVTKVKFTATDGYSTALPLSEAMGETVILAYQLNGEPLSVRHGYPARLIIPSKYGMKNPKWITGHHAHHRRLPGLLGAAGLDRPRLSRNMEPDRHTAPQQQSGRCPWRLPAPHMRATGVSGAWK